MSAIGQILDSVEAKVRDLLVNFVKKNDEQDTRLDDLTRRVEALEKGSGASAAKKATAARPTAAGAQAKASPSK